MPGPIVYMTICITLAMLPATCFAAPNIEPGRWEITSTLEMPGMGFSLPESKHIQCITVEEVIPQAQQENEQCQVIDQSVRGNVVNWRVKCESGGGSMDSRGEITYNGDSLEGTVITNGSQMPSEMTQKMRGKRIGQCD